MTRNAAADGIFLLSPTRNTVMHLTVSEGQLDFPVNFGRARATESAEKLPRLSRAPQGTRNYCVGAALSES